MLSAVLANSAFLESFISRAVLGRGEPEFEGLGDEGGRGVIGIGDEGGEKTEGPLVVLFGVSMMVAAARPFRPLAVDEEGENIEATPVSQFGESLK